MLGLVVTNIARHAGRTVATAVGIALGVATIVGLLSVGTGLERSAGELIHLGQADLGVFQSGVADPTASILPTKLATRLEQREDVASATPLLLLVEAIKQDPAAVVFGVDPEGFVKQRALPTAGTSELGPNTILVGDRLARLLEAAPGDTVKVKRRKMTVAGVYHTGVFFEDAGALIDLNTAQRLVHRGDDATTIAVQLAQDAHHDQAAKALRKALPGTQVIGTGDDAVRAGANGRLIGKATTLIGALALIIGGLGVANTMAMAVLERQRELALLSAVGWGKARIAALVLSEGVATSVAGAGLGLLLGVLGAGALNDALGVSAVVDPHVTPWTIGQGLLIGVAIGVLGGLYPAWRGTSVSGAELLGRT